MTENKIFPGNTMLKTSSEKVKPACGSNQEVVENNFPLHRKQSEHHFQVLHHHQ